MNSGRFVLSQVLDLVHRQTLDRLVERYDAESCVRHFGARQQLICMVFAQLTWREGLQGHRHLFECQARGALSFGLSRTGGQIDVGRCQRRATGLATVGERPKNSWVRPGRSMPAKPSVWSWKTRSMRWIPRPMIFRLRSFLGPIFVAPRRASKCIRNWIAAVRFHLHLHRNARQHDVRWLDELVFEPGAFYVMDRGYMDFKRLNLIACAGAFFVTRAKDNLRFSRQRSRPVKAASGIRSDQIGKPTLAKARTAFPAPLRKVHYFDAETGRDLVFLTNHLEIPALTVASIYRLRWRIELFFRWIKEHLRIKHYFGTSPNAVKTQIWISITAYLMVAILHKRLNLPGTCTEHCNF